MDITQSLGDNIRELARKKNKPVGEIKVAILDRPRHAEAIDEIRSVGAHTRLILDGDVAAGINAARHDSRLDLCYGIGGSPEGVATTCAIKALGGFIQGRLAPGSDEERERGAAAGLKFDYVYSADELVAGDNTFFVATGVTDGELVRGVRHDGEWLRTESVVFRARSGTIRRISSDYLAERWLG
jgi:fructose-1,6-bisphosphatase II